MFLRDTNRHKDGKDHRYYSVVDTCRVRDGRTVQKTLLYLGEINDSQKAAWVRTIEVVEGREKRQIALFPEDRDIPAGVDTVATTSCWRTRTSCSSICGRSGRICSERGSMSCSTI